MELLFDASFEKSIKKLRNKQLKQAIINLIAEFEKAEDLGQLTNIKKMTGYRSFYRVRIGDYRVGFELIEAKTVLFILVAHRRDIYNNFPLNIGAFSPGNFRNLIF